MKTAKRKPGSKTTAGAKKKTGNRSAQKKQEKGRKGNMTSVSQFRDLG